MSNHGCDFKIEGIAVQSSYKRLTMFVKISPRTFKNEQNLLSTRLFQHAQQSQQPWRTCQSHQTNQKPQGMTNLREKDVGALLGQPNFVGWVQNLHYATSAGSRSTNARTEPSKSKSAVISSHGSVSRHGSICRYRTTTHVPPAGRDCSASGIATRMGICFRVSRSKTLRSLEMLTEMICQTLARLVLGKGLSGNYCSVRQRERMRESDH